MLSEILFYFYRQLSPALERKSKKPQEDQKLSLLYFSKFYDVFESLESRVTLQGPEIDLFTMSNVKSEVKEEIAIKSEAKMRSTSFAELL